MLKGDISILGSDIISNKIPKTGEGQKRVYPSKMDISPFSIAPSIYTFPILNLFWKNQYLGFIDQICMIKISQYDQKLIKKVSLYFSHWELSEYI